jgi:hypothetical protein
MLRAILLIGIILSSAILIVPITNDNAIAVKDKPDLFNPRLSTILGAEWWKWVLEIPTPMNPLIDANPCDVNQQGDFFFLAGVLETSGHIERTCTIPEGKAIFFPVYNAFSTFDPPPPDLIGALEFVKDNVKQANNLKASVDGTNINVNKLRSLTIPFEFTLPPDNIFGITNPPDLGPYKAIADGYWVALKPLSVGNHEISFSARNHQNGLNIDVTYHITVQ